MPLPSTRPLPIYSSTSSNEEIVAEHYLPLTHEAPYQVATSVRNRNRFVLNSTHVNYVPASSDDYLNNSSDYGRNDSFR